MKRLIPIVLTAIFFSGCLPALKITKSEYTIFQLTSEKAISRDKDFFVLIPPRWFQTKDVNYDGNEIWLVNENYSSVIIVRKFNNLLKLKSTDNNENLISLARVSLTLHKRKNEATFKLQQKPALYQNGSLVYASFEYGFSENQFARVVILQNENDFFEVLAYTTMKGTGNISLVELFSVQESVVSTLSKR